MKRSRWLHMSLVAVLSAAAVGSACGDEVAPALVLTGNIIPEEQDGECTVRTQGGAGGQQEMRFSGVLDLSIGERYVAFLGVQNNFDEFEAITGFQSEDGRLDPSTITIKGAEVSLDINPALIQRLPEAARNELLAFGVTGIPLEYTVPGAAAVEPGSSGAVEIEVIPAQIGQILRQVSAVVTSDVQVIAEIQLVAERQDGRRIRSGSFRYPIRLCNNCLVTQLYPEAQARDPFDLRPPSEFEPLTVGDLGLGCFLGQDQPVNNAVCGAFWTEPGCQQDRCLGLGADDALACDEDGATISPDQVLP
ncbi:MAG: hypothetical protein ACQEXJ_01000 [Myxococcota bacterium]